MTQSDDTLGRDPSYESKCFEDKLTAKQTVTVQADENEVNGEEKSEHSSVNGPLETEGSPSLVKSGEMGSTDSAGNTHSGGSSCGLVSSLFPNSCRGRAESFARRLHRRLTSLGGEGAVTSDDEDDCAMSVGGRRSSNDISETSWLHAPTARRTTTNAPNNSATSLSSSCSLKMDERVLDSQPRHSPESDVFYDFDLDTYENERNHEVNDENGTNSPVEIANDAEIASILVNKKITRINHREPRHISQECPRPPEYLQDPESGCVFESPLPGTSPDTDNSEMFFDPESSETEKACDNRHETMYDQRAAESEATVQKTVTNEEEASFEIRKHPLRRRIQRVPKRTEDDSSESSSSSCNPDVDSANSREPEAQFIASSEESLNGNKSSLETTSPSHESLWSTFDESTLSLQDESTSGMIASIIPTAQTTLPKSHSDSELVGNPSLNDHIDEVDHVNSMFVMTNGDNEESTKNKNNHSTCSASVDTLKKNLENEVNHGTDDINGSEEGMSRLLERLACNPNVDKIEITKNSSCLENLKKKATNGRRGTNDEREESNETEENEGDHEEEEEENDGENRPQRLRRCSSLKTGKTPPGTPGRKKIVRFADVLGLDLADVRTFLDEIPKVPNSAYSDLIYDEAFQKDSSPINFWGTGPACFTTPLYAATIPRGLVNGVKLDRILVPLFQQPAASPTFLDLVRERQVCLENVVVQDPMNMCLHGTVRVRNLDFHKSVHIRYTLDCWRTFIDLQAVYASNSCDGFSDKFTFVLYCHPLKVGQRLELAVRFQCKGSQYWDNNVGANYCFQCLPATPANPGYIPITAATIIPTLAPSLTSHVNHVNPTAHEWSPTFY